MGPYRGWEGGDGMGLERRQRMMDTFLLRKQLTTRELCGMFGVSVEVIRRDLSVLERAGFLRRVYGGAVLNEAKKMPDAMAPWSDRQVLHLREKQAVARAAVRLIPDHSTIALDDGTTMMELARMLGVCKDLTIITNCLRTAHEISQHSNHTIYLVGGSVKKDELITSGFLANEFLAHFSRIDLAIISADGFTIADGPTDHVLEMAMIKQIMVEKANRTFCVFDHSKFDVAGTYRSAAVRDIDTFIVDSGTRPEDLRALRAAARSVVVAEL